MAMLVHRIDPRNPMPQVSSCGCWRPQARSYEVTFNADGDSCWVVFCPTCHAKTERHDSELDAITAWNAGERREEPTE